jgi:DNA-binding PadR family transcriptional regulator
MPIPPATHLQFLILSILIDGEQSGQFVRDQLAKHKVHKTGPAFYQMMARLEDADFVKGWYEKQVIEGQPIKERHYKITGAGVKAWERTRDFFADALAASKQGGLGYAS